MIPMPSIVESQTTTMTAATTRQPQNGNNTYETMAKAAIAMVGVVVESQLASF